MHRTVESGSSVGHDWAGLFSKHHIQWDLFPYFSMLRITETAGGFSIVYFHHSIVLKNSGLPQRWTSTLPRTVSIMEQIHSSLEM